MRDSHTRDGHTTAPGFFVRRVAGALLLMASVAFGPVGCGGSPASVPLQPAFNSKDAVVEAALQAIAERDRDTLASLTLSETEFRKSIWPALPASDPKVGMPADYVWADTSQKNENYLAQLLAEHGGREYRLIAVTFGGETTDYGAFRVHRKTTLDVRGPAGPVTLRLFGSLVESGGRWKIYSFVVD
jgi:hypothetical protein